MQQNYDALFILVNNGTLLKQLQEPNNDRHFDHPLIRQLLCTAYPYEIQLKYLQQKVPNDLQLNEQIIKLFNEYYHIDYHQVIQDYETQQKHKIDILQTACQIREIHYKCLSEQLQKRKEFITTLLQQQGYNKQAQALLHFLNQHLNISIDSQSSNMTVEQWENIIVHLSNQSYSILYHELTHVVNNFFRYYYPPQVTSRTHDFTKINEWFANFIAYHLGQHIQDLQKDYKDIDLSEHFNSPYIHIYMTLAKKWSDDPSHNQQIINSLMHHYQYSLPQLDSEDFYYQRFYKFFHYHQHHYFYPKELLYYLGYHEILKNSQQSPHKTQLLCDYFLCHFDKISHK